MKKTLLFLLLNSFLVVTAYAEVTARLQPPQVYAGDPVQLVITSNSNHSATPDLEPLKQAFEIVGNSTSSNIQIINGRSSASKSWTIRLQPKQTSPGDINIPAIQVGAEKTRALTLSIRDLPANIAGEVSQHVFVEANIDSFDKEFYVQQQIPYTVKLYYDDMMQTGQIQNPVVENAVVEQLGNERRYRETRLGKPWRVLEKRFVISPEKSGPFTIRPLQVTGRLVAPQAAKDYQQRNGQTDFMNRFFEQTPFANDPFFSDMMRGGILNNRRNIATYPFSIKSKAVPLNILSVPPEFTGAAWLPAESLTIRDSWKQQPPELKVGEPVTRTLTLIAKGLAGSQIPTLDFPEPQSFRVYTEQPQNETQTDGKTVYGVSKIKLTYIPNQAGQSSIPEIKIDWWNVKTKQQEILKLPKWELKVAAGAHQTINPPGKPMTSNVAQPDTPQTSAPSASIAREQDKQTPLQKNNNNNNEANASKSYGWLWLVILPIVLGIAGAIRFFVYNRQTDNTISTKTHEKSVNKAVDYTRLQAALNHACDNNNAPLAAKQLLTLADATWQRNLPEHIAPKNLADLAGQLQIGSDEIIALEQHLYRNEDSKWQGADLKQVLAAGLKPIKQEAKTSKNLNVLKPLYPQIT